MAKGFIFSMDAFVAFTLMLVVMQSLIFVSTIPSTYYPGLTQANYLARDTLLMLSGTPAPAIPGSPADSNITMLEYLSSPSAGSGNYRAFVGDYIPLQYGYSLEIWKQATGTWTPLYNTSGDPADRHNKEYSKLKSSAYSLFMGYQDSVRSTSQNPYTYISCSGGQTPCDAPVSLYNPGHGTLGLVRLTVYR